MQLLLQRPLDYIRVAQKKGMREERDWRGGKGHPQERGHPQEGVRHTPQIRPLFSGSLFLDPLSVSLSRVGVVWPSTEQAL